MHDEPPRPGFHLSCLSPEKTFLRFSAKLTFLTRCPLPTQETIRRKQAEAAEKRIAEQQQRGIKDVESVKRQQRRALELEKREQEAAASGTQPTLRVRTRAIAISFKCKIPDEISQILTYSFQWQVQ